MNRTNSFLVGLIFLLISAFCYAEQSQDPNYPDADAILNSRLIGSWVAKGNSDFTCLNGPIIGPVDNLKFHLEFSKNQKFHMQQFVDVGLVESFGSFSIVNGNLFLKTTKQCAPEDNGVTNCEGSSLGETRSMLILSTDEDHVSFLFNSGIYGACTLDSDVAVWKFQRQN